MKTRTVHTCAIAFLLAAALGLGGARAALAQNGVFAYPLGGQSQEQQSRDRFECHGWAVSQSGFDPTAQQQAAIQTQSAPPPSGGGSSGFLGVGGDRNVAGGQGGLFSDAATGAALGAIGGAIAGNAGTGAAIGALASSVFGGISRSSRQQQEAEWQRNHQADIRRQQEQAAAKQAGMANDYRRAFGACMSSRNYRVQ